MKSKLRHFILYGIICKLTNLYTRVDCKNEKKEGIFIIIFSISNLTEPPRYRCYGLYLKKNQPILPRIIFSGFLLRPVLFLTHK